MRRFGRYLLVDRIASGGMADVHRAKHVGIRGFSRTVAIKRVHRHLAERQRFVRMLTDEAKIASRLIHPNIVQIFDLGEEEGVPYIAMEYVSGRDLFRVLERLILDRRRFPWPLATRVAAEMCAGLQFAHDFRAFDGEPLEIVHRDVSPRNVILSFAGEVKLTDFGIARARDREEHTEHGLIKGKIRYISPEAAVGKHVDHRSDLYSLAVVLVEMLTMGPLRTGVNDLAVLEEARSGTIDRGRLASLPPRLRAALEKALEPDPTRRYGSAREFRSAILGAVDESAVPMSQAETAAFMQDLFAGDVLAEQERDVAVETMLAERARKLGTEPPVRPARRPERPVDDLVTVAPAEPSGPADAEGNLRHTSLVRLLHELADARVTGRLDLRREPVQKTLFLETGHPVFVLSNVESELLGEHLVAQGLLTRIRHGEVLDLAARRGIRFTEALLALEILPPHQLYRALAEQIRDRILDLFTWPAGTYALFHDTGAPDSGLPLNLRTYTLIHQGVQDRVPLVTVRRATAGHERQRLATTDADMPADLHLSGRQQRILRAIESESPTLSALVRQEKDEEQILRLVYMLVEIDRLQFT